MGVFVRRDHAKAEKRVGGLQVATLKGAIVGGHNLRNGHKKQKSKNTSSRFVKITMKTGEQVYDNTHRVQSSSTPKIEDKRSPSWEHEFGPFALYDSNREIQVMVFDKIKKHPVLVGELSGPHCTAHCAYIRCSQH